MSLCGTGSSLNPCNKSYFVYRQEFPFSRVKGIGVVFRLEGKIYATFFHNNEDARAAFDRLMY